MARYAAEREAGYAHPLAPQGISALLALEVETNGEAALPNHVRRLIREMGAENPTWGEERIADELQVKLGIQVSPRTVGRYLQSGRPVRSKAALTDLSP